MLVATADNGVSIVAKFVYHVAGNVLEQLAVRLEGSCGINDAEKNEEGDDSGSDLGETRPLCAVDELEAVDDAKNDQGDCHTWRDERDEVLQDGLGNQNNSLLNEIMLFDRGQSNLLFKRFKTRERAICMVVEALDMTDLVVTPICHGFMEMSM